VGKGGDKFLFMRSYNHSIKIKSSLLQIMLRLSMLRNLIRSAYKTMDGVLHGVAVYSPALLRWYQHNTACRQRQMCVNKLREAALESAAGDTGSH